MARKRNQHLVGKKQQGGPLDGHYRHAKVYRPFLLALEASSEGNWVRDDLPDLLWPAAAFCELGNEAGRLFGKFQAEAHKLCKHSEKVVIDGRLTSLERIPDEFRERLVELAKTHHHLIPTDLPKVLSNYEHVPGAWLLIEPWEINPDGAHSESLVCLLDWIMPLGTDGHLEARAKYVTLMWAMITRSISLDQQTVELLKTYPFDQSRVGAADSVIGATFSAHKAASEQRGDGRTPVLVPVGFRGFLGLVSWLLSVLVRG